VVSSSRTKSALITGVAGQDGSYLAELLLAKGYVVHGLVRGSSSYNAGRIEHLRSDVHDDRARFFLHHGDMADGSRLITLLQSIQPDEVYNLAATSHINLSFSEPELTGMTSGISATRLLEAIRMIGLPTRYYQASSSAMFGDAPGPQHEETPLQPLSPYGAAKAYAYWMTRTYRQAYGMYAVNGIAFNHESPRRDESFVTRKIAMGAAAIAAGKRDFLYLGNIEAVRDWGYAPEYVEGMWAMLQAHQPGDYVLATGTSHTVRDFLHFCFDTVGLDWRKHVKFDERYLRPTEVDSLVGDASKAERELGWKAATLAPELARIMTEAEIEAPGR
jgi:GDPmannose 4,6-dehydratase